MARETTSYVGTPTITPDLTEANELKRQARIVGLKGSALTGAMGIAKSVASQATSEYSKASDEEKAQKNITDSGAAYQESITQLQDTAAKQPADVTKAFVQGELEKSRKEFSDGLISEGTYKGRVAVFQNALSGVNSAAQAEIDNKVTATMVGDMKTSVMTGTNIREYDELTVAEQAGMSRVAYRDAKIEALYGAGADVSMMATSPQSLREAQAWHKEQVNDLRTDPIYRGKNADQQFVKRDTQYKAAVKAKTDALNKSLDTDRAKSDITYEMTPNEYNGNLADRYGTDTKEFVTSSDKYETKYMDNIATLDLLHSGSPTEGYNWMGASTVDGATEVLTEHFNKAQEGYLMSESPIDHMAFVDSVIANPGKSGESGKAAYSLYNTFDSEEAGELYFHKFNSMKIVPQGTNALNEAMTPKKYNEVYLAQVLKTSGMVPSYTNARETAKQFIASQTLAPVTMRRDDNAYLNKTANEFGAQRADFIFLAKNLMSLGMEPSDAIDQVEEMYESKQTEVGDIKINNASPMKIGDEDLAAANLTEQILTQVPGITAENAIVKVIDDGEGRVGIVYDNTDGFMIPVAEVDERDADC